MILQQDAPDDYVIATSEQHSVREFVELAAGHLDMQIRWQGEGSNEQGYDRKTGQCVIAIDPRYFRPTEVDTLLGDASRARQRLGWAPTTSFQDLVKEMVQEDLEHARRDAMCAKEGYRTYTYHE